MPELRTSQSLERDELNKILEKLLQLTKKTERESVKMFVPNASHVRSRSTTVTTSSPHITKNERRHRETHTMLRRKPSLVKSYPLSHSTTNGISFSAKGGKLAGNAIFSGTSFITVQNHARLNPTAELTIALWIKPAAATADGIIVRKNNQYELKLQNPNQIAFRIFSGGAWKTPLVYTYTPNIWVHITATYKSTASGQKLFVNGSLSSSDSEIGAINTTTNALHIGGDGTSNLPNNTALAWLTILSKEVSTAWITDFHANNIISTAGGNTEITTIPFVGDERPRPDATSGLCHSE